MFKQMIPDGAARREGRTPSHDGEYLMLYWNPAKLAYGRPEWILEHNAGVAATCHQDYEEACADNTYGLVEPTVEEFDVAAAEAKQIQYEIYEIIRGIGDPLDLELMGSAAQDLAVQWGWFETLRSFLVDVLGNDFPEFLDGGEFGLIQDDLDEPIERRFVADDNGYKATAVLAGHTLYVDLKANHFVHCEDDIIALLDGEIYGTGWEEI